MKHGCIGWFSSNIKRNCTAKTHLCKATIIDKFTGFTIRIQNLNLQFKSIWYWLRSFISNYSKTKL